MACTALLGFLQQSSGMPSRYLSLGVERRDMLAEDIRFVVLGELFGTHEPRGIRPSGSSRNTRNSRPHRRAAATVRARVALRDKFFAVSPVTDHADSTVIFDARDGVFADDCVPSARSSSVSPVHVPVSSTAGRMSPLTVEALAVDFLPWSPRCCSRS